MVGKATIITTDFALKKLWYPYYYNNDGGYEITYVQYSKIIYSEDMVPHSLIHCLYAVWGGGDLDQLGMATCETFMFWTST